VDLNNKSSHMSEDYDLQIIDTIPYYESFHNETLNIIKVILERPNIWLDTGCGTGTLIQKAFEEFDITNFVLADPSEKMLNKARSKLSKHPQERLTFLEPTETGKISFKGDHRPDVITAIQAHITCQKKIDLKPLKFVMNS